MSGVAAGSLATSVTDPDVYLAGASGGVYALIAAHLANVIFNWGEMEFPGGQLTCTLTHNQLITTLQSAINAHIV